MIGPDKDIPAPDMNTNAQVMAWMMDTYSMNEGETATGVVTGKPLAPGRLARPRRRPPGAACSSRPREAARQHRAADRRRARGRAGLRQCRRGTPPGCSPRPARKVVAVQDAAGTIHNPAGLDVRALRLACGDHRRAGRRSRERGDGRRRLLGAWTATS